nr:hypothetical protein [Candidatus Woesearchaeota archaeon]
MDYAIKHYTDRYSGLTIKAVIKWTPEFLQFIRRNYDLNSEFTSNNLCELFNNIISGNATRLKLWRMYRQGWFTRRYKKGVYYYKFSEGAKKYYNLWYGFNSEEGPLIKSSKPKYMDKIVEVKREIINTDRYLGEA